MCPVLLVFVSSLRAQLTPLQGAGKHLSPSWLQAQFPGAGGVRVRQPELSSTERPSAAGAALHLPTQVRPGGYVQGAGEIWGVVAGLISSPLVPICSPSILGTPFYLLEHRAGHIHHAASLPAVPPHRRGAWYGAMANVLARIHSLDLEAAKLQDLGEHGERSLWILSAPVCQHFKG